MIGLNLQLWQFLAVAIVTFHTERCFAILCYKCDSVTLPDCATSLDSNALPTEECKSAFACAMTIVDSVTYRGCSTNTPRGSDYYKTCSENLCNKGVYPPGRLKCHQCSGKDCVAVPATKPTPCVYFYEIDNCYTDVIDEIDTHRGCASDTIRTPNSLSQYCDINGCNDSPGVTLLTCSKCDSVDARGCKLDLFEANSESCNITNGTTCSVNSLLGHQTETCFLYHKLDRVIRGCTFDSGTLSLDKDNFGTCDSELCNKKCMKQQKCIICDSTKDQRCKSDPSSLTATTCQSAEASSCNACELTDGSVQRGCGVPSVAVAGSRCNQCQGEGCNKLPFTKCYKCTSDESPNCAQWANPNIIAKEDCDIAGADCVTAVFANGKTLRGCESSQLTCNGTQSSCDTCSGSFCNDGVYPTVRLQCHHCDGRDACSAVTDGRNLRACAKYDENDACFEFLSSRGTMVRGCKSDHSMFYECLLAGAGCRLCSGPGCNFMSKKRSAELSCHKCSKEDAACSWQQGNESLVACEGEVTFLSMESCFVKRYPDGSTSRGCTLDEDVQSGSVEQDSLMQTCSEASCNNNATIVQKCIQCQGNVRRANECTTLVSMAAGKLCGNGLVEYKQRGCYTKIDGKLIERGCALNLSSSSTCQSINDCHYCHGIDCNAESSLTLMGHRNSAFKVSKQLTEMVFLILVFILFK